jgi:hypothetical protein
VLLEEPVGCNALLVSEQQLQQGSRIENVSILLHTRYRCMYKIISTGLNTTMTLLYNVSIYVDTQ